MIEDKTVTMQYYVLPYEMMDIKPGDAIESVARHVYLNMPLNDVYEELFGKAVKEYDAHQKRRDRRYGGIDGYMARVDADLRGRNRHNSDEKGQRLAYEVVVSLGFDESSMSKVYTPIELHDEMRMRLSILESYFNSWDRRNPRLRLFRVYSCGKSDWTDSKGGTIHLHLAFVPWADGYERGPSIQTSLNRAMAQQRCESEGLMHNSCAVWMDREIAFIEKLFVEKYGRKVIRLDTDMNKAGPLYKMEKMRQKIDDMEWALMVAHKEVASASETLAMVERMKAFRMPDGRSLWEYSLSLLAD